MADGKGDSQKQCFTRRQARSGGDGIHMNLIVQTSRKTELSRITAASGIC
jgi:hypothetical protein